MKNETFSEKTKAMLADPETRRKCCRRLFEIGTSYPDNGGTEAAEAAARCDDCMKAFLAGLFVVCGSVTDPNKGYHLDFSFPSDEAALPVARLLTDQIAAPGVTHRRGRTVLYYKNSATIEDVLAYLGASGAAFEVMNAKIERGMRADVHRVVNCDTANVQKTLAASGQQIAAIKQMAGDGTLNQLPEELRETALLRLENAQSTLAELAAMHQPPITKSGVVHRLDRILHFYEENN